MPPSLPEVWKTPALLLSYIRIWDNHKLFKFDCQVWWSKCDISHKDIKETYPLSVYIWSKNSNRRTRIRTRDEEVEAPSDNPLHHTPRNLPVCASMRGMGGAGLIRSLDLRCLWDNLSKSCWDRQVGQVRLELTTYRLKVGYSTWLSYWPKVGAVRSPRTNKSTIEHQEVAVNPLLPYGRSSLRWSRLYGS